MYLGERVETSHTNGSACMVRLVNWAQRLPVLLRGSEVQVGLSWLQSSFNLTSNLNSLSLITVGVADHCGFLELEFLELSEIRGSPERFIIPPTNHSISGRREALEVQSISVVTSVPCTLYFCQT